MDVLHYYHLDTSRQDTASACRRKLCNRHCCRVHTQPSLYEDTCTNTCSRRLNFSTLCADAWCLTPFHWLFLVSCMMCYVSTSLTLMVRGFAFHDYINTYLLHLYAHHHLTVFAPRQKSKHTLRVFVFGTKCNKKTYPKWENLALFRARTRCRRWSRNMEIFHVS